MPLEGVAPPFPLLLTLAAALLPAALLTPLLVLGDLVVLLPSPMLSVAPPDPPETLLISRCSGDV